MTFRMCFKLIGFVILVLSYFFLTSFLYIPLKIWPMPTRKLLSRLICFYCNLCMKVFGVKVTLKNRDVVPQGSFLYIGNHMSYLDVMGFAAQVPCCFVTSKEMRETPFLGQISEVGGCLFVERRSREKLGDEVKELTLALKSGVSVVVFPEATSTNGNEVIRFKTPLFAAAKNAPKDIVPFTINYRAMDGVKLTAQNRDQILWYGDMPFFSHFLGFLKLKKVDMEITFHPPVSHTVGTTYKDMAQVVHAQVSSVYDKLAPPISQDLKS